ncbi:hypothetical protein QBC40DRAFT_298765 [Triangularia verruculosa]|uniref:Uncharacterized protein n=1 Tax=Triangularia verruculosa TaxID=2587418 RepID=A0AAN6XGG8_9PEZI|nr:hypothetical protein QBC40DRAFT_298765 [Triangularia verruculosa]
MWKLVNIDNPNNGFFEGLAAYGGLVQPKGARQCAKPAKFTEHSAHWPVTHYKRPRKRDRSGENFRKRWQTLVKTGYALHQGYGARIYFSISIPRTRRDFVCRSDKDVLPIMPSDL